MRLRMEMTRCLTSPKSSQMNVSKSWSGEMRMISWKLIPRNEQTKDESEWMIQSMKPSQSILWRSGELLLSRYETKRREHG